MLVSVGRLPVEVELSRRDRVSLGEATAEILDQQFPASRILQILTRSERRVALARVTPSLLTGFDPHNPPTRSIRLYAERPFSEHLVPPWFAWHAWGQGGAERREQRDRPLPGFALRLDRAVIDVLAPIDADQPGSEVDVLPTQRAKLAAPQAGEERRRPDRPVLLGQQLQERSSLLSGDDPVTSTLSGR
jgi:hypothetical protein